MEKRKMGGSGLYVSALGLGCMGMSDFYGQADRQMSIATIHKALECGITFFNTGDFYGMGHNEMLLGEALAGRRDKAFISVKFGALRGPSGEWTGFDSRPQAAKNFLAYTLKRLGTDYVDLYQPARISADVPIEETVGAISDMVKAGYVRHIGLSEASAQTVRRAHAVHPLAALEIEYSLFDREIEKEVLPTVRELGISIVAYGILSRGLISDKEPGGFEKGDFRNFLPRFQGENFKRNWSLVEKIRTIASAKGVSVTQLATAWVLTRGQDIIPLIGTTKPQRLEQSLATLSIKLSEDEMDALAHLDKDVAGTRYPEQQMATLNR